MCRTQPNNKVLGALGALVVCLFGFLFLLQRDFGHANFWQAVNRITFLPAVRFHQLRQTLRTRHHVTHFYGSGFDFQALVDSHRIWSAKDFGDL